jgi:hypothetical protein
MVICTRFGCGQEFDPATDSNASACHFHSGGPIFHEGTKAWSCCIDTNKPVTSFEDFMSSASVAHLQTRG